MPRGSSPARERQYEHIRDSLKARGNPRSEEIAARTVNKERARSGEAKEASPSSLRGPSSSRRGGLNSHKGPQGRTYDELYHEAAERGIQGRSKMNKAELEQALRKH
ncbi:hypothetical protein [Niveibacterium sp. SC-1]|uniref:hypothetical protein n=1 Tax=Niveibacterium sp. SC-1 TaxID=3135646 RepID=UPI00311FF4EC